MSQTLEGPPYAVVDGSDELFVKLAYVGIEPLVAIIDQLPICQFDNDDALYIGVKTAIAWHENELQYQPNRKGSKETIAALRSGLAHHEAGATAPRKEND